MRDGVRMATDVYRPAGDGRPLSVRRPVPLHRALYSKSETEATSGECRYFAARGGIPPSAARTLSSREVLMRLAAPRERHGSASHTVSSWLFRKWLGVIVQPRTRALWATIRCHWNV
jgi:hypothetical protein